MKFDTGYMADWYLDNRWHQIKVKSWRIYINILAIMYSNVTIIRVKWPCRTVHGILTMGMTYFNHDGNNLLPSYLCGGVDRGVADAVYGHGGCLLGYYSHFRSDFRRSSSTGFWSGYRSQSSADSSVADLPDPARATSSSSSAFPPAF